MSPFDPVLAVLHDAMIGIRPYGADWLMSDGCMRVLAVDTSGDYCSVGLWRDGDTVCVERRAMRHGHAEALMPMARALLQRAGSSFEAVDLFAVTTGPGAFTGLRIGLAAVGGLALATGRPIVGVSAFDALATAVPAGQLAGRPLLVAIDSRRAEPYGRPFAADGAPLAEGAVLDMLALDSLLAGERWALAGSGARQVQQLAPQAATTILDESPVDPGVLARLAAARADRARPDPPAPLYLRPPDAAPVAARRPAAGAGLP
jgi:tRNA threonylcarbamoyladenosine biosynthesis protein TsaB